MSTKTFRNIAALAVTVLLFVPLSSFAALETVTVSSAYMGSSDQSGPFTFTDIPVFNSSLGQLMSIQFNLDLEATPFLQVYNNDPRMENFSKANVSTSGKVTLEIPTTTNERNLQTLSGINTLGPESGTLTPKGTSGDLVTIDGSTYGSTESLTITNFTSMYVGTSGETYDLNAFFTEPNSLVSGMANAGVFFAGGDDLYSCMSVEYFYTAAVPEPSTLPLVALSIGAFFVGRRFLSKTRAS